MATAPARARKGGGIRRGETLSGWLFIAPVLVALFLFLAIPIFLALWVSFTDYAGNGSQFQSNVHFVGLKNYAAITTAGGLSERLFGWSIRNTFWYVVLVVPIQTAVALGLATLVNNQRVRGRGFFRITYYFPSITSSVAIATLWLFLFSASGAINQALSWVGAHGPNWFNDPQGIITALLSALGVKAGPPALVDHTMLGVSLWDWLGGPSWAMSALMLMAIFTTSGTFMLLFLAALQNLSPEVDEAAIVDGANGWQRFWQVTLPQLKPTLFTVLTLGLISSWQVFDQVYTTTQGAPGNTTYSPAYLSYHQAFTNANFGQASAIAFVLFVIIIVCAFALQRLLAEKPDAPRAGRTGRTARI